MSNGKAKVVKTFFDYGAKKLFPQPAWHPPPKTKPTVIRKQIAHVPSVWPGHNLANFNVTDKQDAVRRQQNFQALHNSLFPSSTFGSYRYPHFAATFLPGFQVPHHHFSTHGLHVHRRYFSTDKSSSGSGGGTPSSPSPQTPANRYTGAIVDRERGGEGAVQGPLSRNAHRLLISRNLNIRSSNLNTFERSARLLAKEHRADQALVKESEAMLQDPESSLSQLHSSIRGAIAKHRGVGVDEVPGDVFKNVHALRQEFGKGTARGVKGERADPVTGKPTHPTGEGAFFERDTGHRVLRILGLSSQSGTSGSAADAVRGLAKLLGPEVAVAKGEELTRLVHLYMRHPDFFEKENPDTGVSLSKAIAEKKASRGLEEPSREDAEVLPSHTHSVGEIAQGVHLQNVLLQKRTPSVRDHAIGAFRAQRLLREALRRQQ